MRPVPPMTTIFMIVPPSGVHELDGGRMTEDGTEDFATASKLPWFCVQRRRRPYPPPLTGMAHRPFPSTGISLFSMICVSDTPKQGELREVCVRRQRAGPGPAGADPRV